MAGFRVMVQSEKVAGYLEERVEALWGGFGKHLESLGEVEFGKQRESLVAKKRETIKNLGQEYVFRFPFSQHGADTAHLFMCSRTSRYWYEIESGRLDFFSRMCL